MAFGDFSLKDIKTVFQVCLVESEDLFATVPEVEASPLLHELLAFICPLAALAINTEKGRSELLIAQTLVEVREQLKHHISLFSSVDFNVASRARTQWRLRFHRRPVAAATNLRRRSSPLWRRKTRI